jgi:hypothetical protein
MWCYCGMSCRSLPIACVLLYSGVYRLCLKLPAHTKAITNCGERHASFAADRRRHMTTGPSVGWLHTITSIRDGCVKPPDHWLDTNGLFWRIAESRLGCVAFGNRSAQQRREYPDEFRLQPS